MSSNSYANLEDDSQSHGTRYLVCHDLFWPRIEVEALRERLGLSADISDTQLEVAARTSVELAAQEYAQWRRCLRELGYRRLTDVAGHAQGRALSVCYLRRVEVGIRKALAARKVIEVASSAPLRKEVFHE